MDLHVAICVPPSSPRNGYIYPYPNNSSRVIVVCHGSNMERLHISNCHPNGTWQPNPGNVCDTDETIQGINFYTHAHISMNTPLLYNIIILRQILNTLSVYLQQL